MSAVFYIPQTVKGMFTPLWVFPLSVCHALQLPQLKPLAVLYTVLLHFIINTLNIIFYLFHPLKLSSIIVPYTPSIIFIIKFHALSWVVYVTQVLQMWLTAVKNLFHIPKRILCLNSECLSTHTMISEMPLIPVFAKEPRTNSILVLRVRVLNTSLHA